MYTFNPNISLFNVYSKKKIIARKYFTKFLLNFFHFYARNFFPRMYYMLKSRDYYLNLVRSEIFSFWSSEEKKKNSEFSFNEPDDITKNILIDLASK